MNENDKVDTNLLSSLNQDNYDKTYGVTEPKGINVDASFYTSQTLNTFDKTVGVKTPRCKIVYVITKNNQAGPQVASTLWTRREVAGATNTKMQVYQAKVICPNAGSDVIPYPIDALSPKQNDLDLLKINLHTTAFMEYEAGKVEQLPGLYDEVVIEYIGNDKSEAKILEIFRRDAATTQENAPNATEAFNNSEGTTVGQTKIQKTSGGSKDDPSFATCKSPTFPNLPKRNTTFPKYTEAQVIQAIKNATNDTAIQKICFAIINIEQPKYSFPNNNVAGIQLDVGKFPNTTEGDFDYQTCFRDGGGYQRIFAGFETLDKGMKVFSKIIQGKITSGVFNTLSGDLDKQAEILADNYYRSWNLRATNSEIQELKTKGFFIRKGEKIIRNYNSTKSRFKAKIGLI